MPLVGSRRFPALRASPSAQIRRLFLLEWLSTEAKTQPSHPPAQTVRLPDGRRRRSRRHRMAPRPLRRRGDLATTGLQCRRTSRTPSVSSSSPPPWRRSQGECRAGLIGRTTRRPRATLVIIATAATVGSLSMPFFERGITVTQRVVLACVHPAVAAVLIPVLAATLPAQRRSARTHRQRASQQVTPPSQPRGAPADPPRHLTAGGSDHQYPTPNIAQHVRQRKSVPRLVELLGA